jgi:hypothetical protein
MNTRAASRTQNRVGAATTSDLTNWAKPSSQFLAFSQIVIYTMYKECTSSSYDSMHGLQHIVVLFGNCFYMHSVHVKKIVIIR